MKRLMNIESEKFHHPSRAVVVNQEKAMYFTRRHEDNSGSTLMKICLRTMTIKEDRETANIVEDAIQYMVNRDIIGSCSAMNSKDTECSRGCRELACQELCFEEPGQQAKCGCRYGARLQDDHRSCDYDNLLYSTAGRYVLVSDPETKKTEVFATAPERIMAATHNPLR